MEKGVWIFMIYLDQKGGKTASQELTPQNSFTKAASPQIVSIPLTISIIALSKYGMEKDVWRYVWYIWTRREAKQLYKSWLPKTALQ